LASILVACELSGRVRDSLIERGHEAISCDLEDSESPGPHIKGDALEALHSRSWDALIGFPPCTHLSVSGARWWPEKRKDGRQQKAEAFFLSLAQSDVPFIAIENPVGRMSTIYRKPDQIVQPWWFGDPYTKATCFWLKGFPNLEKTNPVQPEPVSWIHRLPPSPDRGKLRSYTPQGLADAIGEQWGRFLHD
jgi:hypothetical protein